VSEALESLDRCIQLEPRFVEAYFDQGQILERDKQTQRAINAYQKYLQYNPGREMREAAEQAIRNLKRGR